MTPDPRRDPQFYQGVAARRALAWLVDVLLVVIALVVMVVATFGLALVFMPLLILVGGLVYRWWFLSAWSATPGMRLMQIEFRGPTGRPLDGSQALVHTLVFSGGFLFLPVHLISMLMMVTTARGQGIADVAVDSVCINRPL